MPALSDAALDQLFRTARTHNRWKDTPITDIEIKAIYDTAKFGPTAANSNPARFVWVRSAAAKARLLPFVAEGNKAKVEAAPATVIIGYDLDFPETMPFLFPHAPDAKNWFSDLAAREVGALRNSSLQGAYFLLAARALGFDTGPMSGFDNAGVDGEFFAGTQIKSNFIASIGHGSGEGMFPRLPRLDFDTANTVL